MEFDWKTYSVCSLHSNPDSTKSWRTNLFLFFSILKIILLRKNRLELFYQGLSQRNFTCAGEFNQQLIYCVHLNRTPITRIFQNEPLIFICQRYKYAFLQHSSYIFFHQVPNGQSIKYRLLLILKSIARCWLRWEYDGSKKPKNSFYIWRFSDVQTHSSP